jgi:4-amino-4-deoxy-L-arabinose transferase-like glycosyltransferase
VYLLLLVTFWAATYVPALFRPALLDDADSIHAQSAKEMVQSGDWVTLHINNGIRYLEKTPLLYWATAALYSLFGVSEWTTRLPLALGVLALTLIVFGFGKRAYESEEAGFYSALAILTSFGIFIYTRFLIPDVPVGLWITLGMYFFWRALHEDPPSRVACWGLAACSGLAILSKGLIGIVFPVAIVGIYLLLTRKLRHLLSMRPISSFLVFLLVAGPWHLLVARANPWVNDQARGWFWFYVINEHVNRFLDKRVPKDFDSAPVWAFWALIFVWLLPFSAFVIQAVGQLRGVLSKHFRELDRRHRAHLLFGVWAFTILLFFTFSTRQEYYLIPALPALALLIGGWLAEESGAPAAAAIRRHGRLSAAVFAVVGVLAFLAAILLAFQATPPPPGADIAELLKQNPANYGISFGHFFDLTPQALGAFRGPLLGTGIALLLGTGLNWLLRRRGRADYANLALVAMMAPLLICANIGFARFEPIISSKQLALAIKKELRPGDVIVINGIYEHGSTLNFYTNQQVHMLSGNRNTNIWYGSLFPEAPKIFETNESFARLWNSPTRVFLWTEEENKPGALMPGNVYEVARSGGKVILTNKAWGE